MLDDLREQAIEDPYIDDEQSQGYSRDSDIKRTYFLGMTPGQRLFIAVLILVMTCLLSTFFLLITERLDPLFLS